MNLEHAPLYRYPETEQKTRLRKGLEERAYSDHHFHRLEKSFKDMVIDTVIDTSDYTREQLLQTADEIKATIITNPEYKKVPDYMQFYAKSWHWGIRNKSTTILRREVTSSLVHLTFMDKFLNDDLKLEQNQPMTAFEQSLDLCDKLAGNKTIKKTITPLDKYL